MQKAELILTGGKVRTFDPEKPLASAVATAGGKVIAVGTDEEIEALAAEGTERIDLAGRSVIPGLIDSHLHIIYTGWMLGGIDLYGAASVAEVVDKLKVGDRGGDFVAGRSDCLHERHMPESRLPTCKDLDEVATDRAVAVTDVNKTIVNSFILKDIDVSGLPGDGDHGTYPEGSPKFVPGGEIGMFPDGTPNGQFFYGAKGLTPLGGQSAAAAEKATPLEAIDRCQGALAAAGLTGIIDASTGPDEFAALTKLHSEGRLKIRVRMLLRAARYGDMESMLRDIESFGEGDDMLRIAGVKLFYDPFLMHKTALFYEPYNGGRGNCGTRTLSPDELTEWIRRCSKAGLATGTHTTGTKGTDEVITAYEKIAGEVGLVQPSHMIHSYFPGDGAIDRIKALGLGVALQPSFIRPWAETAVDFLGYDRAKGFTPSRSYIDSGIVTGGGTDSPITHFNPFGSISAAAARLSMGGTVLGPEERVSNEEAIAMYCAGSAGITGEAGSRGMIAPGRLADMVVASADPVDCEAADIAAITAEKTIVGGKVVHSAGA